MKTTEITLSLWNNIQNRQTELIKKYWVFWAFSNKQFEANRTPLKEWEKYVSIWHWWYVPKSNARTYIDAVDALYDEWIKELKENFSAEEIIRYELDNHECFYVWDIENALPVLEDYWFLREHIDAVFRKRQFFNKPIKRTFSSDDWSNIIHNKYYPSKKRVVFFDSMYYKNTGNYETKTFKTKKEADDYILLRSAE